VGWFCRGLDLSWAGYRGLNLLLGGDMLFQTQKFAKNPIKEFSLKIFLLVTRH